MEAFIGLNIPAPAKRPAISTEVEKSGTEAVCDDGPQVGTARENSRVV
jgi:hypothetical protein